MADQMKPHPKLGINLRKALEVCGICGTEYQSGMVPMGMQNFKYVCPDCSFVHYGEPERNDIGHYRCAKCDQATSSFAMTELKPKEPVKAGVGCCSGCTGKLGESKVAFIEIVDGTADSRTGNVYFVEPKGELKEQLDKSKARSVYVEESWAKKTRLK